jgi:hypothetical protein
MSGMTEPLGPFQEIWDAWNEAHIDTDVQSLEDFHRVFEAQFKELSQHFTQGDERRAAFEAVDIISVALTVLRWLKLEPTEIALLARQRARERMKGQVNEILAKYGMAE